MSEKVNNTIQPTVEMSEDVVAIKNNQNETAVEYVVDPVEEKKVLRKLDRVILPLMAFVYFFQYLDKQSINYATVFGLSKDLKLTGVEFSWAISLFYFGQLCSEYPAAYLMSRLPITLFVSITIILWGIAEMSQAASQNFAGLAATRFILGLTEGAIAPSFMIITSNWYRRKEHPIRIATWVSMHGISGIVGALMMYGIGGADVAIETWRVMFLICGGLTVACGIAFALLMPRDTTTAWFLNTRERVVATERLAIDRVTRDHTNFDMGQLKEAFTEPRTALYFLMALFITIPTAISKFSSLVISGFGYNPFQTMLVGLPGGACQFITVWIGALGPTYFKNSRSIVGACLTVVPLLGSLMLLTLPAHMSWGIVVGTWFAACSSGPLGSSVQLMATNVKGNTKKSVIGAIFFVAYCVGCIISPQLWTAPEAPRYTKGVIASVVSWCCLIITFMVYRYTGKFSNKKRDALALDHEEFRNDIDATGHTTGVALDSDLTEKADKGFRFAL